jgi:hypothetical protein
VTRILLVETASPKRVRRVAEELLRGDAYPDPEVTIATAGDRTTVRYYRELAGVRVVRLPRSRRLRLLAALRRRRFDLVRIFWTGERRYRRLKLAALSLGRRATLVDVGDGALFRLTLPAVARHALFRLAHPLPRDHWELVPRPTDPEVERFSDGEKILIVESAKPAAVERALVRLRAQPIFRNPRYTLFCRHRPETLRSFRLHPMIAEVQPHREASGALRHLRALRRQRFDGVVVFFTGDPSYWKIKYFAFLLGARHRLIFNENNDCFFFSWRAWLNLLVHRLGERARPGGGSRGAWQVRSALLYLVKLALLPFRFVWLLGVWLLLRSSGHGSFSAMGAKSSGPR